MLRLNLRAAELCNSLISQCDVLRIGVSTSPCGTRLVDCGIAATGGLEVGRLLAEICTAGLARVQFVPSAPEFSSGPAVMITTDQPLAACMAAQYAGWRISSGEFFALGSGPMRAAAAKEALFEKIGCVEKADVAVGILETRKVPPDDVCRDVAGQCSVAPDRLTLLLAPTASLAGMVQVVSRSVETALHKLSELEFDLHRVVSGFGTAPLPPAAADDFGAIGRTNDAILYGGEVTLYVGGDDASLQAIGPRVPSSASSDHGQPFSAIFERYHRDFYRIDPHLFSPAVVTLINVETGNSYSFGHTLPRVIHESFDVRQAAP